MNAPHAPLHRTHSQAALAPLAQGERIRRSGVRNAAETERAASKSLETIKVHLEPLQPPEIPQNHQRFLWKCLEKTSGYLEMCGKS
jgi:hypothetical protein